MTTQDGLHSKVLDFFPHRDERGRPYIAFCNNPCHQGIVLRPAVCEARQCSDYYKYFINEEHKRYKGR